MDGWINQFKSLLKSALTHYETMSYCLLVTVASRRFRFYLSHIIILGKIIVKCMSVSSFNCAVKLKCKIEQEQKIK